MHDMELGVYVYTIELETHYEYHYLKYFCSTKIDTAFILLLFAPWDSCPPVPQYAAFLPICKMKEGDGRIAISMKESMLTDLNKRYNSPEVLKLLEFCSFLDPRFKTQYIEDKEMTMSLVKEECQCLAIINSTEFEGLNHWNH